MVRPVNLDAEIRSAERGVDHRVISWLINNGCTAAGIAVIGANQAQSGGMNVDMRGKHTFETTTKPYGVSALILLVTHECTIVDQIAGRSLLPDAWLWRIGASWALGIDGIEYLPFWDGLKEISLHPTPLSRLQAGANGAVILVWSAVQYIRKLPMFDTIRSDHSTVQRQLSAILRQPERKPKIVGTGQNVSAPRSLAVNDGAPANLRLPFQWRRT